MRLLWKHHRRTMLKVDAAGGFLPVLSEPQRYREQCKSFVLADLLEPSHNVDFGETAANDNSTLFTLCVYPFLFFFFLCICLFPFYICEFVCFFQEQHPGAFGDKVGTASREIMETRYWLLPYLYTLFHQAHTQGDTVVRPLHHE